MAYVLHKTTEDVLICEGARVAGHVTMGKGVSIWYNVVIRADLPSKPIVIGENTNIQDGALLHAGTRVGSGVSIGHGAIVHECTVGNNVIIGMGAVIMSNARIGDDCIVGAGSLVTGKMDIPSGSLVVGSPARVVRPLTEAELASIRANTEEYLEFSELYRNS